MFYRAGVIADQYGSALMTFSASEVTTLRRYTNLFIIIIIIIIIIILLGVISAGNPPPIYIILEMSASAIYQLEFQLK